jgi:hypothetical protein
LRWSWPWASRIQIGTPYRPSWRVLHGSHICHCESQPRGVDLLLTVKICIKFRLDSQAYKSTIIAKGPFFPRVMNPRYRIRGTMCNARSNLISRKHFDLEKGFCI